MLAWGIAAVLLVALLVVIGLTLRNARDAIEPIEASRASVDLAPTLAQVAALLGSDTRLRLVCEEPIVSSDRLAGINYSLILDHDQYEKLWAAGDDVELGGSERAFGGFLPETYAFGQADGPIELLQPGHRIIMPQHVTHEQADRIEQKLDAIAATLTLFSNGKVTKDVMNAIDQQLNDFVFRS